MGEFQKFYLPPPHAKNRKRERNERDNPREMILAETRKDTVS
jgi:hypothetical protein